MSTFLRSTFTASFILSAFSFAGQTDAQTPHPVQFSFDIAM